MSLVGFRLHFNVWLFRYYVAECFIIFIILYTIHTGRSHAISDNPYSMHTDYIVNNLKKKLIILKHMC